MVITYNRQRLVKCHAFNDDQRTQACTFDRYEGDHLQIGDDRPNVATQIVDPGGWLDRNVVPIDRFSFFDVGLRGNIIQLELGAQFHLSHLAIDNGQFVSPAGDVTGSLKQARNCFGAASFANFWMVGLGSRLEKP